MTAEDDTPVFDARRIPEDEALLLIVSALMEQSEHNQDMASTKEQRETLFGCLMRCGVTSRKLVKAIHTYTEQVAALRN